MREEKEREMATSSEAERRSWAELLQNSTQLLNTASPSVQFPPIQRSLDQLESLSRKLKEKTSRLEAPNQEIAATRLLAREGINADQLSRDLKSFELKTRFEDVFQVEATSVDEYLQQVHEMIMISAIQEAQRDNYKVFDNYMMKASQDDWQKEKRDFLNSLSHLPSTPSVSVASSVPRLQTIGTPHQDIGFKQSRDMILDTTRTSTNELKAVAYAEEVLKLNAAREHGMPFKVATAFKAAYDRVGVEAPGSKTVSMGKIWELMTSLFCEDIEKSTNMTKKGAMIVGARRHLERGHEKYILDTIQSHPVQAALGGSTGNLHRIQAFLRVRLRDHGVLDFDVQDTRRQPPMDTTWQQIYYCLRTGYYEEARQVAQSCRVSRSFASQLVEWISTGGVVSKSTASDAAEECERMLRMGDRPGRPSYDKKRMLLYAIISSSRSHVDRLLRDIPTLFNTIEDFLWFMLAVIQDGEGNSFSPSTSAEGLPSFSLGDLQTYLLKFEPSYYTKNGREPLIYPYVLLLSLQLHAAVAYLTKEAGMEVYHIDAVHIAVAIGDHGVLLEGLGDAKKLSLMDSIGEIASIMRYYGLSYVRQGNLGLALEYYAQAAAAMGGGVCCWSGQGSIERKRQHQLMLKQLLTEILLRDGGISLLLGVTGTGSDGALRRFLPDQQVQHYFLVDAARQCQESGLYEKAIELLKRIGAYAMALEIVNNRLSESIGAMARGRIDGETKIAALVLAGNSVLEACKVAGISSLQERELISQQQTALRQLETIHTFHKFARNERFNDAIRELSKLSFLPLDARFFETSAEALQALSPSVQACVPDLLKTSLTCLNSISDIDGTARSLKTKIATFIANSLPRNFPKDIYEKVSRML